MSGKALPVATIDRALSFSHQVVGAVGELLALMLVSEGDLCSWSGIIGSDGRRLRSHHHHHYSGPA